MIGAMPRPRPPHLHREITQHGKTVWYVRLGKGPRTRLWASFGTPEFDTEYRAAIEGKPRPVKGAPVAGTLAWLVDRYRETNAWGTLAASTRRNRENLLRKVVETAGNQPISAITPKIIAAGCDRRTPHQALHFVTALRGMFKWALRAGLAKADPTASVELPARKIKGFRTWSEDDVAAYEARWPIGTRQRVWLDVLLYTGLRRGDAVRLGRQHVRERRGADRDRENRNTGHAADPAGVASHAGRRTNRRPGLHLRRARPAADQGKFWARVPARVSRGERIGVRAWCPQDRSDAGGRRRRPEAQLEAIFGWSGGKMASLYTQSANGGGCSIEAMPKLDNKRTSYSRI